MSHQEAKEAFFARLSPTTDRQAFLEALEKNQSECPWGDLSGTPKIRIDRAPIALILAMDGRADLAAYRRVINIRHIDQVIWGYPFRPNSNSRPNHLYLDPKAPETIELLRKRVHVIMSTGVFTYDSKGVEFDDDAQEEAAAHSLSNLLMPGGLFASDNLAVTKRRFEDILANKFGFKYIKNANPFILQKGLETS